MEQLNWILLCGDKGEDGKVSFPDNFSDVNDTFKVVDDWTFPWICFMSVHPLPEKLQRVFDKQQTVSGQVGVLSAWLIKVAKKQNISQNFIDLYWEAKAKSKGHDWEERYLENLLAEHSKIESGNIAELFKSLQKISHTHGEFQEGKRNRSLTFRNITFKLIEQTIMEAKENSK